MKSRITIELDFDLKNPYIKIVEDQTSPDVRDKLITHFRQLLGHESSWLKVGIVSEYASTNGDKTTTMRIDPITPDMLSQEADEMKRIAVNGK